MEKIKKGCIKSLFYVFTPKYFGPQGGLIDLLMFRKPPLGGWGVNFFYLLQNGRSLISSFSGGMSSKALGGFIF